MFVFLFETLQEEFVPPEPPVQDPSYAPPEEQVQEPVDPNTIPQSGDANFGGQMPPEGAPDAQGNAPVANGEETPPEDPPADAGMAGDGQEVPPEGQDISPDGIPAQEIEPLKRYVLVNKLYDVKSRLKSEGADVEDLDLILKFEPNLSFNTLVALVRRVIGGFDAG